MTYKVIVIRANLLGRSFTHRQTRILLFSFFELCRDFVWLTERLTTDNLDCKHSNIQGPVTEQSLPLILLPLHLSQVWCLASQPPQSMLSTKNRVFSLPSLIQLLRTRKAVQKESILAQTLLVYADFAADACNSDVTYWIIDKLPMSWLFRSRSDHIGHLTSVLPWAGPNLSQWLVLSADSKRISGLNSLPQAFKPSKQ